MSLTLPLRQGHMDGLCGLYTVMNFCLEKKLLQLDVRKQAEWYIFEAAEMEGLLTTYHLYYGFEVQHIFAVFRRLCENLRIPFKPVYLDQLATTACKAIDIAMSNSGAVIAGFNSSKHWILLHAKVGKNILVHDSAATGTPRKMLSPSSLAKISMEAIALMPTEFVVKDV